MRGDANLATLLDYRYRTVWKAERGEHGKGKNQTGASADDVYLPVPPGTVVRDADTGELIGEVLRDGDTLLVARGGGAAGATRASPPPPTRRRASGSRARRARSGGSSWCSSSSPTWAWWASPTRARAPCSRWSRRPVPRSPTIRSPRSSPTSASCRLSGHRTFVMADIPGIIEGAHAGQGLGLKFLQHVERTRVLAFLVPLDSPDPQAAYERLRARKSGSTARPWPRRRMSCVLTKRDLLAPADPLPALRRPRRRRCSRSPARPAAGSKS